MLEIQVSPHKDRSTRVKRGTNTLGFRDTQKNTHISTVGVAECKIYTDGQTHTNPHNTHRHDTTADSNRQLTEQEDITHTHTHTHAETHTLLAKILE